MEQGAADSPADWPRRAAEAGFAADEEEYYDRLHAATTDVAREQVRERERADDQQLLHAIRAVDDTRRTANELAERVAEWGSSLLDDAGTGVEYAREVADREPSGPTERRLIALAEQVVALAEEADALETHVERVAPTVAPNLAALAGPTLAARLIALSGGLESLAKSTSGTVQVLGAEEALFAHLRGHAPSPKHGVIYTHEAIHGTHSDHRGSAARALAGKLTIAARIDHYSGERRPALDAELDERIERIQSREGSS
ncbi:nucleolar [Halobacteriales archaeon SW_7_68_16]|nr:MAG: nucleolar [Halobacteriales archaeon SW_7_68_16]